MGLVKIKPSISQSTAAPEQSAVMAQSLTAAPAGIHIPRRGLGKNQAVDFVIDGVEVYLTRNDSAFMVNDPPIDLFERFLQILDEFEKERVEYVLIGGFAVVLHGFPRLTQDVDIFVKPGRENIERLQRALKNVFDDPSIAEITDGELERYPVIRYGTPEGVVIDIIGRIGEAFTFEDIHYESVEVEGKSVRVATLESLIRMKQDTMREIDQRDVRFLKEKLKSKDADAG